MRQPGFGIRRLTSVPASGIRDLTRDSIAVHIVILATPIALSMLVQIAYQLIDLYFVTRMGAVATAGVSAVGSTVFVVSALAQIINVSTAPLVAQAVGRRDQSDANLIFNQAMTLSVITGVGMMAILYLLMRPYLRLIAADAGTIEAGVTFMSWVLPGLAASMPMTALGSALRGIGLVQAHIVVSMLTVVLNAVLAPILIAGWGTGIPLGLVGAGLATSISIGVGLVVFCVYFAISKRYLTMQRELLWPRLGQVRRILRLGLPAGGEFVLIFLSTAVAYYAIRHLGPVIQAGFGVGSRVLQVILLPGLAIGFAVGPIAAQNFGANSATRVRRAFQDAALIATVTMLAIALFVYQAAGSLLGLFAANAEVKLVAESFLRLMSWSFVAQGLIYVCSNVFQGLGNTVPSLLSAACRFALFSLAALWLTGTGNFKVEYLWYLLIASISCQAIISLWLMRVEFNRRLLPLASADR